MKIIDAHWELRNLNLRVAEILFEDRELVDQNGFEFPFDQYDFILAKIPAASVSFMHMLEDIGFRYLETQFEMVRDLRKTVIFPEMYKAILSKVSLLPVDNDTSLNALLDRIDSSLFDTDRVSLDPLLGPQKGAARYKNWMIDEYESGKAFLAELVFNKMPIGFFLLTKKNNSTYVATLAGLYKEYQKTGLGISAVAKPIEWCTSNGVTTLITRNSSNNPDSLKVHLSCGYVLRDIKYIFRWTNLPVKKQSEG